jgi:hypothetical protein
VSFARFFRAPPHTKEPEIFSPADVQKIISFKSLKHGKKFFQPIETPRLKTPKP